MCFCTFLHVKIAERSEAKDANTHFIFALLASLHSSILLITLYFWLRFVQNFFNIGKFALTHYEGLIAEGIIVHFSRIFSVFIRWLLRYIANIRTVLSGLSNVDKTSLDFIVYRFFFWSHSRHSQCSNPVHSFGSQPILNILYSKNIIKTILKAPSTGSLASGNDSYFSQLTIENVYERAKNKQSSARSVK